MHRPASAALSEIALRFANLQICNRRQTCAPCLAVLTQATVKAVLHIVLHACTISTQILPTSNTCSVSYHEKALKQKGSYATPDNPMHAPQMAHDSLTSEY